ncbi:MAG: hypothetical protein IJQ97_01935 [Paludibacteraceae bacterium]|nr:hypothetical protein [Paludibacteraceae bacterium]
MLFNKDGILSLDEALMQNASFIQIMEDGVVTSDELEAQAQKVTDMFHEIAKRFSPEDAAFVEQLLIETNVLYAVSKKYELQNL